MWCTVLHLQAAGGKASAALEKGNVTRTAARTLAAVSSLGMSTVCAGRH